VLVDTKAEADTPDGKAARQKMIELVRSSGSKAVAEQMMPKMLAEMTLRQRPEIVQQLRQIMESCPPLTIEHALAAMGGRPDRTGILPSIADPTLIIVGESDAITTPAMAQAMLRQIPHAKLAIIGGAGHMSPMEQPQQVTDALRGFLAECYA
jgi:3-oxoadipate enol-lactonase